MRRSPSKIGQTAAQAANTGRKSLEMTPQPPQTALKRQHRRSRRRCSDVPNYDYVIPFTRDEIVHRLNRRQATTPLYFSTTANGHAVRINASQAYLGNGLTLPTAEKVTGQVDFIDGRIMTLSADKGTLENSNSLVTLSGNVVLNSADGITVQTEHLVANLAVLSAQSDVPVRASGAIGELTSGNMTITTRQSDGPLHMLFGNGVQLTYLP